MVNKTKLETNNAKIDELIQAAEALPDYIDVSGVTATAAGTLTGTSFVNANGTLTPGTMANNGAMNKTMNGLDVKSVSIPAGYTSGGTVSLTGDIENIADEQADLLAELDAAVDALPDAGGTVETCTVTLTGSVSGTVYYTGLSDGLLSGMSAIAESNKITIDAVKGTALTFKSHYTMLQNQGSSGLTKLGGDSNYCSYMILHTATDTESITITTD